MKVTQIKNCWDLADDALEHAGSVQLGDVGFDCSAESASFTWRGHETQELFNSHNIVILVYVVIVPKFSVKQLFIIYVAFF